jgi:hypothetical protein
VWFSAAAIGHAVPPLAGGQPAQQLEMPLVQEDVLVGGVPGGHALRVVWCNGEYCDSIIIIFIVRSSSQASRALPPFF